jgi:FkbM family methyltransferase
MSLRSRVKSQLRLHPVVSTRLANIIERTGASGTASRLVAAADIVTVTPPVADARPFTMVRVNGTDQIAAALATDGWLGFERPLPDVFTALVRAKGGLVLDVGANTGFYALIAISVDPSVRVHAFEPYPPVLDLLHANLAINRVGTRVRVYEEAIGRTPSTALLHIPDPSHGLVETSASLNPSFRVEGDRSAVSVVVTTLDGHCEHEASDGANDRVGVIKIDVESLEHEVLAGATSLLERDRPYVVVEVLPTSDIDALETIRATSDYVDVRLRPADAVAGAAVAFDPDGWNHLWIPQERLTEGLGLVESCALQVLR